MKSDHKSTTTILYVIIFSFLYLFILTKLKFDIYFFDTDNTLDYSWIYALNNLKSVNLVFGKNCFFTYGPLGMFLYPNGKSIIPSIIFTSSVYFLDCSILFSIFNKEKKFACIYLFAFASIIFNINSYSIFIIFSLCIVSLGVIHAKHNYIYFFILCLLSSILFLIKFDLAILSLLMIIVIIMGISTSHVFFKKLHPSCDNIYTKPEIHLLKIFLIYLYIKFLLDY